MVQRRTVDLLPEIFRTDTNRKFLAATLDQMIQEPNMQRTQGFVGRRVGPGVNPADNYVVEPTASRTDYQLEPGVVFREPDTNRVLDSITYPGMLSALDLAGAQTQRQDRLWESQYYAWDGFCDLDKFTNYSEYYWLPQGPDAVDVSSILYPLTDEFEVTDTAAGYELSGWSGTNPEIVLVRGGNYEFEVNQPGSAFWIQASPGASGRLPFAPNISSRDVLGVINNGAAVGRVTFDVPQKTAQDIYYNMPVVASVDLVTGLKFNEVNNVFVEDFLTQYPLGIDGITNLDGRTIIFLDQSLSAEQGGWFETTQYSPLSQDDSFPGEPGSFDTLPFDLTTPIEPQSRRYSIWRISYQGDQRQYMSLSSVQTVAELSRVSITFGSQYSSTQWFRNALGFWEQVPLLTAIQDILYYQDGVDTDRFGIIRLIDSAQTDPLLIDEIIGAKNYVSPNGVRFTNGLKVRFRGRVSPAEFQDQDYYVEGVGSGPGTAERVGFVDGEAYYGPWHLRDGQRVTGPAGSTDFQQFIYASLEDSIVNRGRGTPDLAPLPRTSQPGAVVGNGIRLVPVRLLVTPERYLLEESTDQDPTDPVPLLPDYITVNRASQDLNAWSRSNRWFHEQVIRDTAGYNNSVAVLDNRQRARRPIIEFRANLNLFDSGTQGIEPVDIIDFEETDALSNIAGTVGYTIDGYEFQQGTRVIFAADIDPLVRNRVYRVDFIDPDGEASSPRIIDLVPLPQGEVLIDQMTVCRAGDTLIGRSFWYNGVIWQEVQPKTGINQPPRFDVYDIQGRSFGDSVAYPSTNFQGSRLFGYAPGAGLREDIVLGFPLRYRNINNIGDIEFENFFYTDTFVYLQDRTGTTVQVSSGVARQYIDRVTFSDLIGWVPAAAENRSRQVFRFTYAGEDLILDVPVDQSSVLAPVQVFVGGVFADPDQYTVTVSGTNTFIRLTTEPPEVTVIEVQVISNEASTRGFYQVPLNLEYNALNQNSDRFTLGSIRNHYKSIAQNLRDLTGPVIGNNNSRDLGDILPYGSTIVQQSSPLVLAGTFLRRQQYNIFDALRFNSQEYEKFKARMMDLVAQGDFINNTPTEVLDIVIEEMGAGRTESSPFYWSDMLPSNETYTLLTYPVTPITIPVFDLTRVYDFSSSNFQSVLVYVNGIILTRGTEYTVGTDSATVTITAPLSVGDVVTIREYQTTFGSYVPNTPTKMGLYPAYVPQQYLDTTAVNPVQVIRGHDGSITRAYDDIRDLVLLEFEKRIFNNLKVSSVIPLEADEVIPGQFRVTDYSLTEITEIMSPDFLSWVGWNRLDYTTQIYQANNEFTYNYSQASDRLTNQPLLGAWRGIYQYFYDTTAPNLRPWEMLGFSQEPLWWENQYGPPPYTSGNLVLWEDLANGIVADPDNPRVLPRRQRPGLLDVIPAGSEGELLSPLDAVVGIYDSLTWRRSWTVGDDGPVENAWRQSSSYPFAVIRLLAVTRPAKFFALFADRDRYRFDSELDQYLWQGRYRLDASDLAPLYGNGVSRASYINWILDYNRQRGVDSTQDLTRLLANTDVRLCWRLAGFSDKKLLKLYVERSTPGGSNAGFLLPDESYQLMLYRNQPFARATYSSVIVQQVERGWSVQGYNLLEPYFEIWTSRPRGITREISAGGETVRVSTQYDPTVVQVPYGYVFENRAAVCDFLLSYGQRLASLGMTFDTQENGYIMDWNQMCAEFLYWSAQGWQVGSLINLNPASKDFQITRPGEIADSLTPPRASNIILSQNRQPIPLADLVIDRLDNTFRARSFSADTINYINLDFTAWEHILVLDNTSLFGDLVYEPITGSRQSRILVAGWISGDWNGQVNAPGFVLNENNIGPWQPRRAYNKGEIVLFKDQYWSAAGVIQPSEEFNYNLWIASDFDEVQIGLLPNAATASDELAQAYNVQVANLEQEIDLFSYGLIGFRPRQYMQALNLDDVSQVNLYRQFLGTKGTRSSLEIFTLADLGKETAEYNIYEYWSVLRGTYGANANRSYIELLLDQAQLPSDPSLIEVIFPDQASVADQTVPVSQIWKSSYPITSPDILTTSLVTDLDRNLPTAGYVRADDVDFTTFSLDATDVAESNIDLDSIGVGTTIWVARINSYDWNVYSCRYIPSEIIAVSDNLDGFSVVTFDGPHGLATGDQLIIRFFNDDVNGFYQVQGTPNINTVLILYEFTGFQTTITGLGSGFTLDSVRVAQASDIVDLPISRELRPGTKIWVDNNSQGLWEVLEKISPFEAGDDLVPDRPIEDSQYGQSLAQGLLNLTALVGSPGWKPDPANAAPAPGTVYAFVRTAQDQYEFGSQIVFNTEDVESFGSSIDVGDQVWSVIGANASGSGQGYAAVVYNPPYSSLFEQRQILIASDLDWSQAGFGTSVTMSKDERWIYVGAPGQNKVYAYARVDVQPQSVEYIADGSTDQFPYSDDIIIDPAQPDQLQVRVDNRLLYTGNNVPGYSVVGDDVMLNFTPTEGSRINLSRRTFVQLDNRLYYNVEPSTSSPTVNLTARFTVDVTRGVRNPTVTNGGTGYSPGDIIEFDGANIGGGANLTLEVVQVGPSYTTLTPVVAGNAYIQVSVADAASLDVGDQVYRISGTGDFPSGALVANVFGTTGFVELDQAASSGGDFVFMVGPNPITEIGNITGVNGGIGNTATFDVESLLATATDISAVTISVNGVLQRPYIDYTYVSGNVTFLDLPPVGAEITVQSLDHYQPVSVLTVPAIAANVELGRSVSTTTDGRQVIVAAPGTTVDGIDQAGQVYVFDRSVQRFVVSDVSSVTYFTDTAMTAPVTVRVNGQVLLDADVNIGGQYTVDIMAGSVTFQDINLAVGDTIEIETNQFEVIQTLTAQTPDAGAEFGYVVDQCVNDCSLYVSAPFDNTITRRAGIVEFLQNQARIYGTIQSIVDNPTLTAGDHLRVNNVYVELSNPAAWSSAVAWPRGTFVQSAGVIYQARVLVPTGTALTNTDFWQPSRWIAVLAQDIQDQTSNVQAQAHEQYLRISVLNREAAAPTNLLSVLPGTGTLFDDLGFEIYYPQQIITSPIQQQQAQFGQSLFISDDTLTLIVGAPTGSMVVPTTFDSDTTLFDADSTEFAETILESGSVYEFDFLPATDASITNPGQFVFGQQIVRSTVREFDRFGTAVDLTTGTLLIGTPGNDLGDSELDYGTVVQLVNATRSPAWRVLREQSPSVDIDLLNSVYIYNRFTGIREYLDYFDPLQGRLLGAVRQNLNFIGAQDPASYNVGIVNNQGSRWGQERVGQIWWDTDRARFIDPNQGDAVYASLRWGQLFPNSSVDIYQWVSSSVPPAQYAGPGTVRSLDSYVIASGVDAQGLFVTTYYFWVQGILTVDRAAGKTLSIETLSRYIQNPRGSGIAYMAPVGPGTFALYNSGSYISALDTVLHVEFDREVNDAAVHEEFQLVAQGLPESFLDATLYRKFVDSFSGTDRNGSPVPDPFLPPSELYGVQFRPRQSMFRDRLLALQNYLGRANAVLLTFPAAENRIFNILNRSDPEPTAASGQWNLRLADYEELTFQDIYAVSLGYRYLVASDSTNNGLWTIYQVQASPVPGVRFLQLVRVQTYDTRLYWNRRDWYEPGYDPLTRILRTVPNVAALETITVPTGSSVRVLSNSQGLWEIYRRDADSWRRVALENGTIEFSETLWNYQAGRFGFDSEVFDAQYFDQEPTIETRNIIDAINQEIFVGDLAIERNRLLTLMFDFILTEQLAPNWLTKTSLIDVDHVVRELEPFQIYREDNQDFVLDYIQEVKPYHVQIREFNLRYRGQDQYLGSATDFDLPAYWDDAQQLFVSPVLDNSGELSTTSSVPSSSPIWQEFPYNQWFQNYLLEIESVTVVSGGSGYSVPPQVEVQGTCVTPAQMRARINSLGQVSAIDIVDPGQGYSETAVIVISGGNGSGARAVAGMGNGLVRNIVTRMRFDRYRYQSDITDWQANVAYDNGIRVRYLDRVWEASSPDSTVVQTATFDPDDWTLIPAQDLDGLDRTRGYYAPTDSMPGIDLAQLISGLEYPGVQVSGIPFPEETRYTADGSTAVYAFVPAQDIQDIVVSQQQVEVQINSVFLIPGQDFTVSFAPNQVTFVEAPEINASIVIRASYPFDTLGDAIYASSFTDTYLGTRPTDINVSGGAFVDTYESHAPEELMPGIGFDTLDFRVYTTPGSDWQGPGHGFPFQSRSWTWQSPADEIPFGSLLPYPVQVRVWNQNTGLELAALDQYTVDWVAKTVSLSSGASAGDVLRLIAYELGGGNQLFRDSYNGADVGDSITVPINRDLIFSVAAFVNGVQQPVQFLNQLGSLATEIVFFQTWTAADYIVVTVFGSNTNLVNYSWSTPQTQYFVYAGTNTFALSNSMDPVNPINVIVNVNGRRIQPAGSIEHLANGLTPSFALPIPAGYLNSAVVQGDVTVYTDGEPTVPGVTWSLDPDDGSSDRTITFATAPALGTVIVISVGTASPYSISGQIMSWDVSQYLLLPGDVISVTSWNDTQQQELLTQVWQGPEVTGALTSQGYDDTLYDQGSVPGNPGSFDYGVGIQILKNRFDTGRIIPNPSRLVVTLNGEYLWPQQGYSVDGSVVVLAGAPISPTAIVAITSFTMTVIPGSLAFRIFQDMRGAHTTYRINDATTTSLTQPLLRTQDTIHVADATKLPVPKLDIGRFGLITINGERIAYRSINVANNTVSSLLRGTAGTAVADHDASSLVYDISIGNRLPQEYQDQLITRNFYGDGMTTEFTATGISVQGLDSTEQLEAVRVRVGGTEVPASPGTWTVIDSDPVTVEFVEAPPPGVEVEISVLRGLGWYRPGPGTPSDGVPLQETTTLAARFFRGV